MTDEAARSGRSWDRDHMLVALVEASAQRAADQAATQAVHDTFRLLGVNLADEADVRATRESMTAMRDRWHAKRDSSATRRRATIQAIFTMCIGFASAVIGTHFGR
jgi:hypothetical protein